MTHLRVTQPFVQSEERGLPRDKETKSGPVGDCRNIFLLFDLCHRPFGRADTFTQEWIEHDELVLSPFQLMECQKKTTAFGQDSAGPANFSPIY